MSWTMLPPGLWQTILQYVSFKERLGSCSLVSRDMREAAAACTTEIETRALFAKPYNVGGLLNWLKSHGQHINRVQLVSWSLGDPVGSMPLQLPCPHLQQLHLGSFRVSSNSGSGSVTRGSRCSSSASLTKLVLSQCQLEHDISELARMLATLSKLQHLELQGLCLSGGEEDITALPSEVVQQLTQITHLSLANFPFPNFTVITTEQSLLHISMLSRLQELRLIGEWDKHIRLSRSTTPGISCLTALTWLQLAEVSLDMAVLQPLTGLCHLYLSHTELISSSSSSSMAELLTYISRLAMLQKLGIEGVGCRAGRASATAYTALTANSNLQALAFQTYYSDPPGVFDTLFAEGRSFNQCTSLTLHGGCDKITPYFVSRLASCCQGLQQLKLGAGMDADRLQPLTQLTALTCLTAVTAIDDRGDYIQPLAVLTGLRKLRVRDLGSRLRLLSFLPLTQLQHLTNLQLFLPCGSYYFECTSKDEAKVWQQLQREAARQGEAGA